MRSGRCRGPAHRRSLDKGPENPSIGLVDLELRVPLHAETEAVARILDPLDDAVLGDRVDDEAGPAPLPPGDARC